MLKFDFVLVNTTHDKNIYIHRRFIHPIEHHLTLKRVFDYLCIQTLAHCLANLSQIHWALILLIMCVGVGGRVGGGADLLPYSVNACYLLEVYS